MCIQNKCANSSLAPIVSCISNRDQLIHQAIISEFSLPYSPMDCDSYLSYLYIFNTNFNKSDS